MPKSARSSREERKVSNSVHGARRKYRDCVPMLPGSYRGIERNSWRRQITCRRSREKRRPALKFSIGGCGERGDLSSIDGAAALSFQCPHLEGSEAL
jgi:hypothetical protein